MRFIDLFAGLGGFHLALRKNGHCCVFACEIDQELRDQYQRNFSIECDGDINHISVSAIPSHDLLCAGFPCQPFSKAGHQRGLQDQQNGTIIYKIIEILRYHSPSYFILENVPNIKGHNHGKTWQEITKLLNECGYALRDYIVSPHQFGIAHKRERIFIIGARHEVNFPTISLNKENSKECKIENFLETKVGTEDKLGAKQIECLQVWQEFIEALPTDQPLPKFPIWAMEFGCTYPLERIAPYYLKQRELACYRGAFGTSLQKLSKEEQLNNLPYYAIYQEEYLPDWKKKFIVKNRNFWNTYGHYIKHLLPKLQRYINSWQKLEWNAGDGTRNIFHYLLQFRSSGIRVKSRTSVPSLVLTKTQTPVIGWEKRYLSLKEAQRLQGFEEIDISLPKRKAVQALGNAVNVKVVTELTRDFSSQNRVNTLSLNDYKSTHPAYLVNHVGAVQ